MQQINLEQVKVAVVGAGTMGIGIAQLAAMHGHPTYVFDLDRSKVQSALTALEAQLSKRVQNGKMTQQLLESTFANLIVAEDIQQLADAGLIIEAIVEKKEVKQNLFQQLAAICPNRRFCVQYFFDFHYRHCLGDSTSRASDWSAFL